MRTFNSKKARRSNYLNNMKQARQMAQAIGHVIMVTEENGRFTVFSVNPNNKDSRSPGFTAKTEEQALAQYCGLESSDE